MGRMKTAQSELMFGVKCETCGRIFISDEYDPPTFWYINAAKHWIDNPSHEVNFYAFEDDKLQVYCFSEKWRRATIVNVLREIQHFKGE